VLVGRSSRKFIKLTLAFTGVPEERDVAALIYEKHKPLFADKGLNEMHSDLGGQLCGHTGAFGCRATPD